MTGVVHIAGQPVQVGTHHRQRCSWCGAVIDDVDLSRVAVLATDVGGPWPSWEVGALVLVDGGIRALVEHDDGAVLPAECCGMLDPAATA